MIEIITCPNCGFENRAKRAECISYADLTLHIDRHSLEVEDLETRRLTLYETRILAELMRFPEQICSRGQLFNVNDQWDVQAGTLSTLVHRLRKKLRGSRTEIITQQAEGYALTRLERSTPRCLQSTEEQRSAAAELVKKTGCSCQKAAIELNIPRSAVVKAMKAVKNK